MECARHESRMMEPVRDGNGTVTRVHLEKAARQGNKSAVALLEGPPFPEELEYLWDWFEELNVGRGAGIIAPSGQHVRESFTFMQIAAWAQLTDRHPLPHEVKALLVLDGVYRHPEFGEKEDLN